MQLLRFVNVRARPAFEQPQMCGRPVEEPTAAGLEAAKTWLEEVYLKSDDIGKTSLKQLASTYQNSAHAAAVTLQDGTTLLKNTHWTHPSKARRSPGCSYRSQTYAHGAPCIRVARR